MSDYDNELQGALFKNDKKGNEKAPDYKGPATIHGVVLNMSAWINEPKGGGTKYIKIKFEKAEIPTAQEAARPAQGDEIPF